MTGFTSLIEGVASFSFISDTGLLIISVVLANGVRTPLTNGAAESNVLDISCAFSGLTQATSNGVVITLDAISTGLLAISAAFPSNAANGLNKASPTQAVHFQLIGFVAALATPPWNASPTLQAVSHNVEGREESH